jgi:hypothetical protein
MSIRIGDLGLRMAKRKIDTAICVAGGDLACIGLTSLQKACHHSRECQGRELNDLAMIGSGFWVPWYPFQSFLLLSNSEGLEKKSVNGDTYLYAALIRSFLFRRGRTDGWPYTLQQSLVDSDCGQQYESHHRTDELRSDQQ